MILLKKISLINFLSHSKTEIEFKSDQKILIDGKSGSGKSSVVDGLVWALYNKGRSDNRSLIKHGTTNAKVSVTLEDNEDNKVYRVDRTINKSNKHELKIFERIGDKKIVPIKTKGTKESQEHLEKEILHSSYTLFINSIVYPQENTENFVKQTAVKRKDIILEIIKASAYDEYLKKAKEELQKIKTEKEVLLSKIEGERNFVVNNEDVANKLKEYEKEDISLRKEIDILKEEYQKYIDRQNEINDHNTNIKVIQGKLEMKLNEYDNGEDNLKNLNAKIIDLSSINIDNIKEDVKSLKLKKSELEKYNKSKDDIIIWNEKFNKILSEKPVEKDHEAEITEINKNLIDIIKEVPEACPKCGYIDPKWNESHQTRIKYHEELLKTAQDKLKIYDESIKEYSRKEIQLGRQPQPFLNQELYNKLKEDIRELEKSEVELARAEIVKEEIGKAEKEINSLSASQKILSEEIEKMTLEVDGKDFSKEESALKNNVVKINGKIDELLIKHSSNKELLGIAKHSKEKVSESKAKLKKYEKDVISNDESLEHLELIKGAFGPNGIKAIVIDYLLPELEDRINNILSKLSDFRIELSTQKSGAGKDVVLEGLFINIINDVGEQFSFSNYSGGEKSRISYAIFEALASLSKINFRILDEAFFALDNETATNFVSIVNLLQENVSNVICITHLPQIKDLFEEKITIIKINGNSKINV